MTLDEATLLKAAPGSIQRCPTSLHPTLRASAVSTARPAQCCELGLLLEGPLIRHSHHSDRVYVPARFIN